MMGGELVAAIQALTGWETAEVWVYADEDGAGRVHKVEQNSDGTIEIET